ncbi:MAG: cobalamin B12-binding domain-containing protein [Spongiibacteraceae bacterium]
MKELDLFKEALLSLDQHKAEQIINAIEDLDGPLEMIEKVVVPTLDEIGAEWIDGTVALSQLYMSGRICEQIIDAALPAKSPDRIHQPCMAIVTLCDYHILGKRIVSSILRAAGYELADYGTMGVEKLVAKVIEDQIKVLLISTLMLPSALRVKDVRKALEQRNYPVTIIVGGAPFRFDEELYKSVDADHMCIQASAAVEIIKKIENEGKA